MAGLFIKLDTNFWSHPAVLEAGEQAAVLYLQMAMHCMDHSTDGLVLDAQLPRFGLPRTRQRLDALADAGLIERAAAGWLLPGYAERYPSAAELEHRRQVNVENGRKGGRPRKQTGTQGVSCEKPNRNPGGFAHENQDGDGDGDGEEQSSSHGSAARPPAPDDDLPSRIWAAALIASPGPTEGDRATIAAAQRRGWPPDALLAKAAKAARAEHDVTGYLRKVLTECANSDPPTERSTAPTNGETRDSAWAQVRRLAAAGQHAWGPDTGLSDRARAAAMTARQSIRYEPAETAKWAFFAAWDAASQVPA